MSDAPAAAPAAPASPSSAPSAPAAPTSAATASGGKSTVAPGTQAGSGGQSTTTTSLPHGGSDVGDKAPATNNHPDAKPGETKAETVQRLKFKVKVRGQELEREYSPEEAQLYVQKGHAFEANAQETANIRKTFQSFMEAVKENPFEAFKDPAFGDLGTNFKQLVIDHLAKEFQNEELKARDPREFELNQLRADKARWEATQKKAEEARQAAAQKEADDRMWAETKKSWVSALEASGFGDSPQFIHQMASIGQEFLEAGIDLDPRLLIAEMKTRMATQQKSVYGGLKGEQLVNALGEDVVNELLTFKVEQARKGRVVQDPIKPPEPSRAGNTDENEAPSVKPAAALRSFASFLHGK